MKELTKSIVAGVSTVALAGGVGAGLAYADTPSDDPTASPTVTSTSSPTETPKAKPNGKGDQTGDRGGFARRRLLARALHGEATLAGEVQKVGRTSVTVKSNDGFVETYALSDDTKVRENGEQAKIADIDTSDRVSVVALKDESTLNARRVVVRMSR
jgi:hypothetical protein